MRSSKSRSRSKNNRNRNSLGNVVNRVFDSNGPEGKVRGTPQQIIDKYNQLARDAALGNDRVAAENFQQHAEHYLRMLSEAQREVEAKREQQERENRERQAQRDKDRAERDAQKRDDRDEREGSQQESGQGEQPQPRAEQRSEPQPAAQDDVIDMSEGEESGLVETPENRSAPQPAPAEEKPKRTRRSPRKKAEPAAEGEGGEKPEKKPRSRKPASDEAPTPDAAE
ncbi:DUF4167 domain-containing protein [Salipiger bermudensis]|uniref:DUF4167 domain-containing protein n=1 Tax=Salipiger bermudensis TaxID=344736 RepID=UPI001C99D6AD|nr:DUF4167 domain-containing protein [Salipiger bermudensis]MBY6005855.1 DUF4167 domain-containing protein [Salipiger bermudensis]